ncbi:MAG: hypothetical protein J1E63_09340 [Muribaculaceae bacterium]|nr:hypothetical protein [Muribaculaceae bacterium]
MKRILMLMLVAIIVGAVSAVAQVVTVTPQPLQQSSRDITITFHADRGTAGLKGYTGDVYAHTGVITSLSGGQWHYAPSWGDNSAKYKLKRVDTDVYTLTIPDINQYYGITNPAETVLKLAFVFRSADCSREGKETGGKDIFVDVAAPGFALQLTSTPSTTLVQIPSTVTFTASTTSSATIEISVNGTVAAKGSGTSLTHSVDFTKAGDYTVTARATDGAGQTMTKTLDIAAIGAATARTYPGGTPRMGAVTAADGSVTFCIAAPGKNSVILVPSWDDYKVLSANAMYYHDHQGIRYFWTTVKGLSKGVDYPYYYLVDGQTKVADPCASLVLDPENDRRLDPTVWPDMPQYPLDKFNDTHLAVYRSDMGAYSWRVDNFEIPDHDDLIIYELLLRDFTGTEGQANAEGTLRDAIDKIPYLHALGVNAVELMPIMEFSGNNSWGYNPNFYMAPDKAYGSPADYKEFIDECHLHGIAVILDIALNHADGHAPWYRMYPAGSNPFFNPTAPHDYSVFNDWRQEYAPVQLYWKEVIDHWMQEYRVDGFRFDLVKGLGDSDSYAKGTEAYNPSRVANLKRLHSYITANNPRAIHINEGFMTPQEETELAADGQLQWYNVNGNSCQWAIGNASNLRDFYAAESKRPVGSTVSYAESHDEQRLAYFQNSSTSAPNALRYTLGERMPRLASLAAMMLLTPGSHLIWQFGELGDDQNNKNGNDNNTNPKRVVWSHLDNTHRGALKQCYQDLIWIRRANPDLFDDDASVNLLTTAADWASGRFIHVAKGGREILLVVNPYHDSPRTLSRTVSSLSASNYAILSSSAGVGNSADVRFNGNNVTVTVPANNYIVLGTLDTAGVDDITTDLTPSVKVTGTVGVITISGLNDVAHIFTLAGTRVKSVTADATVAVEPGIYIVSADGISSKVIVK